MLTAKSPVVERLRLKFVPAPGVIVIAPVDIREGVDTEVEERSFVAESVSVENVKSASSINNPPVDANVTLPEVRAELVIFPPESVVYVAAPSTGVTSDGDVANTATPVPVSSDSEPDKLAEEIESVFVP